jgi:hypothetical protein
VQANHSRKSNQPQQADAEGIGLYGLDQLIYQPAVTNKMPNHSCRDLCRIIIAGGCISCIITYIVSYSRRMPKA